MSRQGRARQRLVARGRVRRQLRVDRLRRASDGCVRVWFTCVRVCEGVPGELVVLRLVLCLIGVVVRGMAWSLVSSVVRLLVGDGRLAHAANDVRVQIIQVGIAAGGEGAMASMCAGSGLTRRREADRRRDGPFNDARAHAPSSEHAHGRGLAETLKNAMTHRLGRAYPCAGLS